MFTDCFGKALATGDDVIVSLGRNRLHCGIVMEVSETRLEIACQYWDGDREYTRRKVFDGEEGKARKIDSIYKINRR